MTPAMGHFGHIASSMTWRAARWGAIGAALAVLNGCIFDFRSTQSIKHGPGAVTARVQDPQDRPVGGVLVHLEPELRKKGSFFDLNLFGTKLERRSKRLSRAGRHVFSNLGEDTYHVWPESRQQRHVFEPERATIRLADGESQEVTFRARRTGRIRVEIPPAYRSPGRTLLVAPEAVWDGPLAEAEAWARRHTIMRTPGGRSDVVVVRPWEGPYAVVLLQGGMQMPGAEAPYHAPMSAVRIGGVEVADGETAVLRFHPVPPGDAVVRGVVSSAGGERAHRGAILLLHEDSQIGAYIAIWAEGNYEASGLAPGRYRLWVEASIGNRRESSTLTVELRCGATRLDIEL